MKTFRVYAEERIVCFKDFEAKSKEEALEMAEVENPATWDMTGDYSCSFLEVETDREAVVS